MSRSDQEDVRSQRLRLLSAMFGSTELTMTGNLTLESDKAPILHFYDPNGADRTLVLPAVEAGLTYIFVHVGSANTLTIQDSAAATVATLVSTASCWVASRNGSWQAVLDTAVASGASHKGGLVPDPGVNAGTAKYLREDMTWVEPAAGAGTNFIEAFTDGSNTATGSGATTFKFRSADSSITVTVTDNDVTHGDNLDIVVAPSNVDHDSLSGFVANEHIDHSGVTLTAGVGISGGGTIAASRTFDLDLGSLAADTPVVGDEVAFSDTSGGADNKCTITVLNGILVHDDLVGFVADEHIAHSGVSITRGTGLSGGGAIDATRTINLDLDSLDADTPVAADLAVFIDVGGADQNKVTFTNLVTLLDSLTGTFTNKTFDANASGNSLSNVDLTADITGTLPVANGGTGATTLTDGGILLGSGTSAITAMGVLADGSIVVGDGTTDPVALAAFSSSTGNLLAAKGGTIGQQTLWIPAGAMEPRVTTAPATLAAVEVGTSLIALRTMDFADLADDHAGFAVQMPKGWDEGTVVAQYVWSTLGTQTGGLDGVAWFIRAGAYASSDVLTTALGTAVGISQNHSATANDVMISAETAAITIAGSPAAEEWVYFEIYRDVSDAADDLDIDARLHGVKIHYTIDAGNDN